MPEKQTRARAATRIQKHSRGQQARQKLTHKPKEQSSKKEQKDKNILQSLYKEAAELAAFCSEMEAGPRLLLGVRCRVNMLMVLIHCCLHVLTIRISLGGQNTKPPFVPFFFVAAGIVDNPFALYSLDDVNVKLAETAHTIAHDFREKAAAFCAWHEQVWIRNP